MIYLSDDMKIAKMETEISQRSAPDRVQFHNKIACLHFYVRA